jgi:2-iminobutanoate/2-iminopropanoate deaminase
MSRSVLLFPVVVLAVAMSACVVGGNEPPAGQAKAAPAVEYFAVPGGANLPFSEAVRVGPMLYLAGQIGSDASGNVVSGGIEAETKQVLENIKTVLERHDSSLDRVVKCTAMLLDMKEWAAMNGVYVTYFTKNLPARSAFGTTGLARGARIELECWATVGDKNNK